jgi:hypothetical protein
MQSPFTYQCIVHRAAKFSIPEQKTSKPRVSRVTEVLFEGSEETELCVRRCGWQAVGDPPCSFALAPSDLHFFGPLK